MYYTHVWLMSNLTKISLNLFARKLTSYDWSNGPIRLQYIPTLWSEFSYLHYIQKARYFAKSKTIYVTFVFTKKRDTLRYAICHEIFEIGIFIYIKSMTLWVTWRFYKKISRHFEKSKTICVTFFYIKKAWHFALHDFLWNF